MQPMSIICYTIQ